MSKQRKRKYILMMCLRTNKNKLSENEKKHSYEENKQKRNHLFTA